jgi:competence protein ComEC
MFLAGGLVWGYALLAGAGPSALRAAAMVQLFLTGAFLGRKSGVTNAVAVVASGLLLWRPWWFQDVGWRLSVTAVLVLGAYADLLGRRGAGKSSGKEESALSVVWEGIAAGILAWGATAGISASVFGPVPLAGVLVNMVAIPVFAVLLPLASLAALPALLGLPGGGYVAGAMEWLFLWWEKGADGAATLLSGSLAWSWLLGGGAVFLVTALVLESCGIGRGRTCLIATILSGSVLVFSGA